MSKSKSPRRSIASNSELYKFHRSRLRLHDTPHPLKRESELCLGIKNLSSFRTKHQVPPYPRAHSAAVLVALFVGRAGDLYVLLSRQTLRSYAGDTALPGGRVEDTDETIEDTARREAFEEIGLPTDKDKLPLLCVLDPFLAGNQVLVTPVVVLILDNTLQPVLNAPEVETLFSHPLASFLSTTFPERAAPRGPDVSWPWPWHPSSTPRDSGHRSVRMHRFLTGREAGGIKPVYGLTAAILIRTAAVAYGHLPDFTVQARDEPELSERVAWSLRHPAKRLEEVMHEERFEAERAARLWDKWEGGRWKPRMFRQRAGPRL
ncbi:NUDIX hydrolase domain-like protein [Lactarius quietus]|nr:NUDIX hydrolase domain-like protein [Lactarius quietus]